MIFGIYILDFHKDLKISSILKGVKIRSKTPEAIGFITPFESNTEELFLHYFKELIVEVKLQKRSDLLLHLNLKTEELFLHFSKS